MSTFHGWRCDECAKTVNTSKPPENLPDGWVSLTARHSYTLSDGFPYGWCGKTHHFCSRKCVLRAVQEAPARARLEHETYVAEQQAAIEEAKKRIREESTA